MSMLARSIAATIAGATLLVSTGCEDAAAKERLEVQQTLAEATDKLRSLSGSDPGGDAVQQTIGDLRAVVQQLNGTSGGADGQQAAKSMLVASALREIAALEAGAIASLESADARRRDEIGGKVDAALRLGSLADGLEQTSTDDVRDQLSQMLASTQRTRDDLNSAMAELDEPISRINAENERDLAEANRLQEEANTLFRQAIDLGPREGLKPYLEAKSLESDADELRFKAERNQIDLDNDLGPRHRLAEVQAGSAEDHITAIEASNDDLDRLEREASNEARDIRSAMQGKWDEINSLLGEIDAGQSDLNAKYEGVAGTIEQALAAARSAAGKLRGADGNAARVAVARGHEALGRLHAMRAMALGQHAMTLGAAGRVAAEFGSGGQIQQAMQATESAQADAVNAAREALQAAAEALNQVSGGGNEVTAFRTSLNDAIVSFGGQAAPGGSGGGNMPISINSGGGTGGSPALQLGGGAGSPQELADALGTINGMADIPTLISLGRPLDTVDGLSPGLRSAAEAVIGFFGALGELDGLTQEKWGRSLNEIDDLGNGMGDSIQLPQSAVVDVVSGNLGQLTVTMQDGSEEVVEIIEIGGRWYLDQSDPMGGNPFMSMDGGMGGGGEGMDNEMAMQMAETMSEMIVGMFQGMEQIMRQLSSEVRDGSLATFDDLDARGEALADELMGDMMPGGMPGGGGFPGGGG